MLDRETQCAFTCHEINSLEEESDFFVVEVEVFLLHDVHDSCKEVNSEYLVVVEAGEKELNELFLCHCFEPVAVEEYVEQKDLHILQVLTARTIAILLDFFVIGLGYHFQHTLQWKLSYPRLFDGLVLFANFHREDHTRMSCSIKRGYSRCTIN